jgi:hypothetical protein
LDEWLEKTKNYVDCGVAVCGDLYLWFESGFRGQVAGLAPAQRRSQCDANPDSGSAYNSTSQPADRDDTDSNRDSHSNSSCHGRTNSD